MLTKLKNGHLWLVIHSFIYLLAGLLLLLDLNHHNHWTIQGIGFMWVVEGFEYLFQLYEKVQKNKASSL